MEILKRSVEELILLYKLEPEIRDIYVEGISDKLLFDRFVKKNKLEDVKVIQVHEVDFSSLTSKFPTIKSNNRAKLIAFNTLLEIELENKLNGITIIIDVDFDEITGNFNHGTYLNYTDYNSLELYLYNADTIDIFYKNFLHPFPINGNETIEKLSPILVDSFLVRLTVNKNGHIGDKKFTPFSKSIKVSKKKLEISFDAKAHILKILNNTQNTSKLAEFEKFYTEKKVKVSLDPKKIINGHDFINMFFLFVDKIKNNIGLTCETLERALFQCVDFSNLKKEALFSNLIKKYS